MAQVSENADPHPQVWTCRACNQPILVLENGDNIVQPVRVFASAYHVNCATTYAVRPGDFLSPAMSSHSLTFRRLPLPLPTHQRPVFICTSGLIDLLSSARRSARCALTFADPLADDYITVARGRLRPLQN